MTVIDDSRGVPQLVGGPGDMAAVEDAIIALVSMTLDHERCRPSGQYDPPAALRVILAVDLLCSMEKEAVEQAREVCAPLMSGTAGTGGTAGSAADGPADARTGTVLAAIASWAAGDLTAARDAFQSVVDRHPGDVVSIFAVHMLDFFLGDAQHMLRSVTDVIGGFPGSARSWRTPTPVRCCC
jgi:hypothetical protein